MKVCSHCQRCYDDSFSSCTETGHSSLEDLRPGSCGMIAGYQIEQLLDSGLRGELYRSHEETSGSPCLIRLLPGNFNNSQQFISEGLLASAFFHLNVADVYDAGELASGELYVVAEDTRAQSLRQLLGDVGIPELLTSVQIVRQTAEAVHALHQSALTHGALNPENITLATDDNGQLLVKVGGIDFGGTVQRSIITNKFLIDTALDSIRYFAPEQCSLGQTSPQTDVYSLGVMLYELIAGTPPFDAPKAVALIEKHKTQPPPEIKIDNFELRMLLTHTLSESLQKQPRFRQSSANAFARQLRHIEQLATHTSTPPPAVAPAPSVPKVSAFVSAAASNAKPEVIRPFVPMIAHTESGCIEIEERVGSPERDDLPWNAGRFRIDAGSEYVDTPELEVSSEPVTMQAAEISASASTDEIETISDVSAVVVDYLPATAACEVEQVGHSSRLTRLRQKVRKFRSLIALSAVEPDESGASQTVQSILPKEIKWERPMAGMPSEEDVLKARLEKMIVADAYARFEKNGGLERVALDDMTEEPVAARAFKKVEWLTPDDDIPSEDAIREALCEEPIRKPAVPAIQDELVVQIADGLLVERKTKVIEPENDVLPEYSVSEITVDEGFDVPMEVKAAEPPVSNDIIADVVAETLIAADDVVEIEIENAGEPETSTPIEIEPDPGPVRPTVKPAVISIKVESDPVPAPDPVKHVDPSQVTNVAVDRQVIGRLVCDEPPTPVRTITRNTREITHLKTVHTTQPTPSVRRVQIQSEPVPIPLPPAEVEEITIVRARPVQTKIAFQQARGELPAKSDAVKVVRGKGQRPAALPASTQPAGQAMLPHSRRPTPTNENPKVIRHNPGNRIRVHTIDLVPSDGILSTYAAPSDRRFAVDYRAFLIGGGFIALLALVVLGNIFFYRFVQSDGSGDTAATQTAQTTKQRPGKTGPILTVKQIPARTADAPVQDVVDEDSVRPAYRERVPLFPEKAKPADIKDTKTKVPNAKALSQYFANLPPVSSTIVIYSENGQVRSRTEPDNKPSDKRAYSRPTATSRPRVVKDPKP